LHVLARLGALAYSAIMALRREDLETLRTAVRNAGLRATPSRIAVLHLLRSAGSPVSHGDVVAKLASQAWDPATIYRNLTDLRCRAARRTDGRPRVALRGDHGHQTAAHPHFSARSAAASNACPTSIRPHPRQGARAVRLKRVEQLRGRATVHVR
jgi:Fur family ferric uptake transcriptional regulator